MMFLDPRSPEAKDPERRKMVRAFENLICARIGGLTIELDYMKHFTEDEFDWINMRIDEFLAVARLHKKVPWWMRWFT